MGADGASAPLGARPARGLARRGEDPDAALPHPGTERDLLVRGPSSPPATKSGSGSTTRPSLGCRRKRPPPRPAPGRRLGCSGDGFPRPDSPRRGRARPPDADRPTPRRGLHLRTPAGRTSGALSRLDAWLDGHRLDDQALTAYLAELHDQDRAPASDFIVYPQLRSCSNTHVAGAPTLTAVGARPVEQVGNHLAGGPSGAPGARGANRRSRERVRVVFLSNIASKTIASATSTATHPGHEILIQLRNPRPTMLIAKARRHHALNPAREPAVVSPQVHDLSLSHPRPPLAEPAGAGVRASTGLTAPRPAGARVRA